MKQDTDKNETLKVRALPIDAEIKERLAILESADGIKWNKPEDSFFMKKDYLRT